MEYWIKFIYIFKISFSYWINMSFQNTISEDGYAKRNLEASISTSSHPSGTSSMLLKTREWLRWLLINSVERSGAVARQKRSPALETRGLRPFQIRFLLSERSRRGASGPGAYLRLRWEVQTQQKTRFLIVLTALFQALFKIILNLPSRLCDFENRHFPNYSLSKPAIDHT